MTITHEGDVIYLRGHCRVEEAEPLTALLQGWPEATLDLSGCEHLHGAVVQAILAFRPSVLGAPDHGFVRDWIVPIFTRP